MAGRPITNHSEAARLKREQMRRQRQVQREQRPAPFNYQPLASVVQQWSRT